MSTTKSSEIESNKDRTHVLELWGLGIWFPTLSGAPLVLALKVKSLEVILDASITVEAQVSSVARLAFKPDPRTAANAERIATISSNPSAVR